MASTALRPRERDARTRPPGRSLPAELMKKLALRTSPEDILHEKLATLSERVI